MNVKNAIVQGENYRFTVLTPSMIRMEYSEKGVFVDKKTQIGRASCRERVSTFV